MNERKGVSVLAGELSESIFIRVAECSVGAGVELDTLSGGQVWVGTIVEPCLGDRNPAWGAGNARAGKGRKGANARCPSAAPTTAKMIEKHATNPHVAKNPRRCPSSVLSIVSRPG